MVNPAVSVSQPAQRLQSQLLAGNAAATPHAVVSHFGAMQAQDYLGALWAVGVRMGDATEAAVERAIEERRIVRCWPMRGTLHFIAAEDVRWMLDLLAPRVLLRHRKRLEHDFELDPGTLGCCRAVAERALRGGQAMTRAELYGAFEEGGIATSNGRALHIVFALAHEQVLCFGPRRGKQPTFVLLDEWLPPSKPRPREEALADLARRYLRSHAPATEADFAWWSGLTPKEALEAIALAGEIPSPPSKSRLWVHLLPPFDEYTVAYKDRTPILDPRYTHRVNAGGGMLNAVLVVNGMVTGIWKRTLRGDTVSLRFDLFRPLTEREERAAGRAAGEYAAFLGLRLVI